MLNSAIFSIMKVYKKVEIYIKGMRAATMKNVTIEYAKNSAYLMYFCDYEDIDVKVMEE